VIYRNAKILQLAKESPCQCCGNDDGTVVAAHRNEGKGMGLKVSDALIAYMCYKCHHELDNGKELSRDERRDMWNRACIKTMQFLIEKEYLIVNSSRV
jgi:uncharacterized CHY-type Zn-finger protein